MTERRGVVLLGAAGAAGLFAAFVALTGGIDTTVAGVPLRSRSWERPAMLALILALAGAVRLRREIGRVVAWMAPAARVRCNGIAAGAAAIAAAWSLVAGVRYGTFAVGGADSYGYVSQANLLLGARLTDPLVVDPRFTWPDAPATLTPLGYTRGRAPSSLVPIYPPGLPLLMAPLAAIHRNAVFLLVPVCAAAAVLLCFRLGAQVGDPFAGSLAAALLSVSPTFLYQAVQPMSDVPAATFWIAALVAGQGPGGRSAAASGALASIAVMIRPNLAPLMAITVACSAKADRGPALRRGAISIAAALPALILLGVLQYVRYGSALSSGYGPPEELFSAANIGPNLSRYSRWLTDTHTPFIWLWVVSPVWMRGWPAGRRRLAWICWAFVLTVWALYLPYVYFRPEEWFYTRFLLPALPLMLLLGTITMRWMLRAMTRDAAGLLATALVLLLLVTSAINASRLGALDLWRLEARYPAVGRAVRERVPASAYILAWQHSGSLRYYAQRPTIRWDLLDPAWLDRAVAAVHASGHEMYAVLDRDELDTFRERFTTAGQQSARRLVPVATVGRTQIFRVT